MLLMNAGKKGPSGGGTSTAYANFQARASLGGSDATNYGILLDGLTTDGLFNVDGTSSKLDALYILAAPDSATALLNLVQNAYNLTTGGSGNTFTANRGYATTLGYLDTNFNPSTAVSANFQLQDAHYSAWIRTNAGAAGNTSGVMGAANGSGGQNNVMFIPFTGSSAYFRCNGSTQGSPVTISSNTGHFLANRTGASAEFGYLDAVDQSVAAVAAAGSFLNATFLLVGWNSGGHSFTQGQVSAGTIGAGLTSGQVTALQSRLATFMSAVGA